MHHCTKMKGRAPKIVERKEWQELKLFMHDRFNEALDGFWLSITDEREEGIWQDFYTKENITYEGPFIGGYPNGANRENLCYADK